MRPRSFQNSPNNNNNNNSNTKPSSPNTKPSSPNTTTTISTSLMNEMNTINNNNNNNNTPVLRSSIQNVIAEARNLIQNNNNENINSSNNTTTSTIIGNNNNYRPSILKPSRPYTPRDPERKLFLENEYSSRPTSSFSINNLSNFDIKLNPLNRRSSLSSVSSSSNYGNDGNITENGKVEKYLNEINNDIDVVNNLNNIYNEITINGNFNKIKIIEQLSKFMDLNNKNINILILTSNIILKLNIENIKLFTIKLLFKLSKQEKYDKYFNDERIIINLLNLIENNKFVMI
ncbi:hypothetical protein ABK040_001356 [Willaertia magna]